MSKNTNVARRTVWYVIRTFLIIALIGFLSLFAFKTGMIASNLYIIAMEGMALRAECILQDGAVLELTEYFTQNLVENDKQLYDGTYDSFTITDYNYDLNVKSISVWPWSDVAKMQVIERVSNITGSPNQTDETDEEANTIPRWQNARYELVFSNIKDRWCISAVTLLETNPEEKVLNTPDMSLLEE